MNAYDGSIGVSDAEEGPSKEKRPRIEAQESSDVSSPTSSLASYSCLFYAGKFAYACKQEYVLCFVCS